MPNDSLVTVRLRMVGAQIMARDTKRAAAGLNELERGSKRAARGLGAIKGGRVQSQMARMKRGTQALKHELRGLGGLAGSAGRALKRFGIGAVIGAGAAMAKAGSQTIQFDEAMRNVNSIAQLGEGRLARLGTSVRKLGAETAQAPQSLAEGLYDLVSSGFDANQSLVILRSSSRAASAGLTDTATSTKAVAAVLNAYRMPASKAGLVSDQLFRTVDRGVISFEALSQNIGDVLPFASSLGIGLEEVGAATATMTKAGINAPETMTRIKAVMASLLKPGKSLSKTLKSIGYESGEALVKEKGLQGALDALAKTTGGSKQKMAALFPNIRALGGSLALTGENAKIAAKDLGGMRDASGATARALAEQSKSIAYQWRKLKAGASSLAIGLGSKLVPHALKLLNTLRNIRDTRVGRTISDFVAGARGTPKGGDAKGERALGAQKATPAEGRGAQLRAALEPAVKWVQATLPKVGATLKRVGAQLLDAFAPAMPFITNVVLPLLKGIAIGVIGGVVMAFKIAVPIIKLFATALGFVGRVMAPFRPIIQGIGSVIGFLVGGPILALLGSIGKVGLVFRLLRVPIALTTGVLRRVGGVLLTVGKAFLRGMTFMRRWIGFLGGLPGRAGRFIVNMISSVVNTLTRGVSRIAKAAGKIGRGIVTAVVEAIKSAPGAIVGMLSSVIERLPIPGFVKGKVKDVLGMASGGTVAPGGLRVVGEHGPELAALPGGSQVVTASDTRRMLRESQTGTTMLPPSQAGGLVAHLVVNLDGRRVHEGVHRVERQLAEAR